MNCNNTIAATLDLAQAVETFKQTIAKELLVDEVSQWDGRIVRDREQKIRQAALILAGQCIALLLHQLSESNGTKKSRNTCGLSRLQLFS